MPDEIRLKSDDEQFEDDTENAERGIGESDDEFDDEDEVDEEDEDQDQDEDSDSPRGASDDRGFTSEIGSEGGSQGDLETERRNPRVMRGSEATTTAATDDDAAFGDRKPL